jgi:DNA (cytosine-5)-methyltransferase 1
VDTAKQPLTVLSICTGYGGIERGLELAGEQLEVLAHVEIEAFAIANLLAKMEQGKLAPSPVWTDLKTLPVDPFRDRVDLITGGYPCQPFSASGKRAGKDDPRHLWPYISDIIESVRPVRCFFENVEGHISLGLREVLSDLESLGYNTAWGIFSADEVGAAHQRKRVYILADSIGAATWNISGTSTDKGRGSPTGGAASLRQAHGQELPVRVGATGADSTVPISATWSPEPNVGRVVDGCANRVDRIRLLGNGVVPQTAAKAWTTLN